ncbi:hypothetical protein DPMN_119631 [Dreissena polymorpha]|uniref:Uncharacterized protein n=1 Tax=Dreissena polymorpha TaxID=45954 RepID=A0A9D4JRF3_DREPO|nr:hypothetical protein DPMN_119631 [Dreissena polymorpha]
MMYKQTPFHLLSEVLTVCNTIQNNDHTTLGENQYRQKLGACFETHREKPWWEIRELHSKMNDGEKLSFY